MQASQETMQASLDKLAPLAPVAGERTLWCLEGGE
jgi:hypothetical protein